MIKVYSKAETLCAQSGDSWFFLPDLEWDSIFHSEDPAGFIDLTISQHGQSVDAPDLTAGSFNPPIQSQEVWAAGVTYYRSRDARMSESKKAGGDNFYDRVYDAERPELFYKGSARTVVGHRANVGIRFDSSWNVPEPEITLAVNADGRIFGYTIGNDMSSRDIEGENPLYLPQAKVYNRSCSLGPCIYVTDQQLKPTTRIHMRISRGGTTVVEGETQLKMIKRPLESLVEYLYRDNVFPRGSFLMTGTGIVPPDTFSLKKSDSISITIDCIGTLVNTVG